MSTITVNQAHEFSRARARECLGSLEEMMGKYGATLDWEGDEATIKGFGVSGGVTVMDDCVEVVLILGMMAKAAGVDPERLEGSITRRLATAFGPEDDEAS
jgi:putative polyhydroxyalkanoate system protein